MNIDVSHKMRLLSLIAFGGVMLIHSAAPLYSPESATWNRFFAGMLCESLTRWAVPFFFFGSGFWFGKGKYFADGISYIGLLKGKAKSLLLPYFIWTVIGALVGVPLIVGTNFVSQSPWTTRTFLDASAFFAMVDNLFGLTHSGPMHCGVLWFVRSLLFCFVLAPVWKTLARLCRQSWLLFAIALAATVLPGFSIPYVGLSTNVMGQFVAGVAIARLGWIEKPMHKGLWLGGVALWITLSVFNGLRVAEVGDIPLSVQHYLVVPGVIAILGSYDHIRHLREMKLHPLALETFWLYLTHQMMAAWVIAIAFAVFGKGNFVTLALVFATPTIVIPISLSIAYILKTKTPNIFGLLTGGRG